MNLLDEIKKAFAKIKDYFANMPKDKRKKMGIIGGIVVALIVVLTLVINLGGSGYTVLYKDIESAEAGQIYQALITSDIKAKMNEKGEVMVPRADYNQSLLLMASQGFPNSSLPYSIFESHSGLTSTESERKQWLIYQLQDRLQDTLKSMDGIVAATVTVNIPETSDYVWQQTATGSGSTAGVLLTFRTGTAITETQVNSIKTLVAASVPQLTPENVTVVNAATREELGASYSSSELASGVLSQTEQLEFEEIVRRQIESNIVRVLTPRYGKEGVVATAFVTIDYDSMITESMQLQQDPEGDGYTTHFEENWSLNEGSAAGDIVGEENNTDIPQYAYNTGDGSPMTDYNKEVDYEYGYIKQQIEKGAAVLKRATVAVMVDEENLTEARRSELTGLVSAAADIAPELIYVSSFRNAGEVTDTTPSILDSIPLWQLVCIIGGALVLIIIIISIAVAIRRAKKRKAERKAMKKEAIELGVDPNASQEEIERYKRELADAAMASVNAKDNAIMDEVRDFARDNPEITANLLRSWLKEGE